MPVRRAPPPLLLFLSLGLSADIGQVEFILMGGTFMSLPADYRDYFVRGLHDALSGHVSASCAEAVRFSEQSHTRCIGLTIETRPDYCLAPHLTQVLPRPSALTSPLDPCVQAAAPIERPAPTTFGGVLDVLPGASQEQRDIRHPSVCAVVQMLSYGCTRLEIGLQSIYEDVARDTNRGHTVAAVAECFQQAKDAGFKARPDTESYSGPSDAADVAGHAAVPSALCTVGVALDPSLQKQPRLAQDTVQRLLLRLEANIYCDSQVVAHLMPDLPNVGWERDLESVREFFENPAFRTDGLKLYPTLVIRGTGLYELWKVRLRGSLQNSVDHAVRFWGQSLCWP